MEHRINVLMQQKQVYSGHLKLGGVNPAGENIGYTNYYMTLNGYPYFPICGEFHYSRYPYLYWEEELLKLKACAVSIVSTYVFWNHHEEIEGEFVWDGDRNVRYFIELCLKHDIKVMLRIGPFAHGEARNGGFPDWLYGRPFTVRTNDEGYLHYVKNPQKSRDFLQYNEKLPHEKWYKIIFIAFSGCVSIKSEKLGTENFNTRNPSFVFPAPKTP